MLNVFKICYTEFSRIGSQKAINIEWVHIGRMAHEEWGIREEWRVK